VALSPLLNPKRSEEAAAPAPIMKKKKQINQCDGCRQGLPLKDGVFHMKNGMPWSLCTKDDYQGGKNENQN